MEVGLRLKKALTGVGSACCGIVRLGCSKAIGRTARIKPSSSDNEVWAKEWEPWSDTWDVYVTAAMIFILM